MMSGRTSILLVVVLIALTDDGPPQNQLQSPGFLIDLATLVSCLHPKTVSQVRLSSVGTIRFITRHLAHCLMSAHISPSDYPHTYLCSKVTLHWNFCLAPSR
ncbi:uncharacterized protein B0T15DRAFT_520318 [Chaetomium strumarium]|uniref:Secreted protein n=1 Tax=Chaetomium strumarium TaxID=1170767 RepID=A0AAJ0H3C3_9PEZI|nr:hypothetical protein B0T15DRAFT_520318 [Chaetomium strumarium]